MKDLRSKLTNLASEKKDIVSLKMQVEEQYKITATQLKAKVETLAKLSVCLSVLLLYTIETVFNSFPFRFAFD